MMTRPLLFFKQAKIVRAQEPQLRYATIERRAQASNRPTQWRGQRDPAANDGESRKQFAHLGEGDAANIGIAGIVIGKVVPKEPAAGNEHAVNLLRHPAFHFLTEYRGE